MLIPGKSVLPKVEKAAASKPTADMTMDETPANAEEKMGMYLSQYSVSLANTFIHYSEMAKDNDKERCILINNLYIIRN